MPALQDLKIGYARELDVCVMFFDIAGFSKRINNHTTLHMLNLVVPEGMNLVRDYGGIVEKNTGDGVMGIFGADTSDHSQKVTDAVGCAISLRYVVQKTINPMLTQSKVEPVDFRIGIDKGSVLVSRIGIHSLSFLTAVGPTANLAFKLQEMAGPNRICIGHFVYESLPDSWKKLCQRNTPQQWDWTFIRGGRKFVYDTFLYEGYRQDPA